MKLKTIQDDFVPISGKLHVVSNHFQSIFGCNILHILFKLLKVVFNSTMRGFAHLKTSTVLSYEKLPANCELHWMVLQRISFFLSFREFVMPESFDDGRAGIFYCFYCDWLKNPMKKKRKKLKILFMTLLTSLQLNGILIVDNIFLTKWALKHSKKTWSYNESRIAYTPILSFCSGYLTVYLDSFSFVFCLKFSFKKWF